MSTSTLARQWLTKAEAADHLGVTERTIRNYISRGVLTGYRVPGSHLVRIDRDELAVLLAPISGEVPHGG